MLGITFWSLKTGFNVHMALINSIIYSVYKIITLLNIQYTYVCMYEYNETDVLVEGFVGWQLYANT